MFADGSPNLFTFSSLPLSARVFDAPDVYLTSTYVESNRGPDAPKNDRSLFRAMFADSSPLYIMPCFLPVPRSCVFQCLGPTDSDWNEKSFRVTERGCVGGRKQPALLEGADFMQFSDATVSRRHFEIVYDRDVRQHYVEYHSSMLYIVWQQWVPRFKSAPL